MMDAQAIRRAQVKLELRDIVLHTSSLDRNQDVEPLLYPTRIRKKSAVDVVVDRVELVDSEKEEINILRAYVHFLLTALSKDDDGRKNLEIFTIKVVYRVDYLEQSKLTQTELDAFTQFNSIHNAWPFWRQHVTKQLRKQIFLESRFRCSELYPERVRLGVLHVVQ